MHVTHETGTDGKGFFVDVDQVLAEPLEHFPKDFDGTGHLHDAGLLDGRSEHDHVRHFFVSDLTRDLRYGLIKLFPGTRWSGNTGRVENVFAIKECQRIKVDWQSVNLAIVGQIAFCHGGKLLLEIS